MTVTSYFHLQKRELLDHRKYATDLLSQLQRKVDIYVFTIINKYYVTNIHTVLCAYNDMFTCAHNDMCTYRIVGITKKCMAFKFSVLLKIKNYNIASNYKLYYGMNLDVCLLYMV